MKDDHSIRRELELTRLALNAIEYHHKYHKGRLPTDLVAQKLGFEDADHPMVKRALHRALSIDPRYYVQWGQLSIEPFPLYKRNR
jgi:hypothetical protein